MKRIKLTLLLTLCFAVLAVGTVVQARQTEVNLSAWTHDQLYLDYFNSRLPEWEAANPDIKFTYDFQVHSQTSQDVLNALAAGEQIPDLIGIEQGTFPNFMRNGTIANYFVDLTDLIGEERAAEYAPGRWALYSYQGRKFAIESSLTAAVLYYQPALFEAAGVEVPATWEQLLSDVGPKLAANGNAFTFATNDGSWFTMYFWQRGGAVFHTRVQLLNHGCQRAREAAALQSFETVAGVAEELPQWECGARAVPSKGEGIRREWNQIAQPHQRQRCRHDDDPDHVDIQPQIRQGEPRLADVQHSHQAKTGEE